METRTGHALIEFHQQFALLEHPQERRDGTHIHGIGRDIEQVIEDARHLVEHHADILAAQRHLETQQLLDGQHKRMLLAHRADVIEAVEIGNGLRIGLVFDQLLGAAVQQADMRIDPAHDFAVHFHDHAQNTVGRGMLRPEIHGHRFDMRFGHQFVFPAGAAASPAFSSPGNTGRGCSMPSQGDRKSNERNSCTSFTGS